MELKDKSIRHVGVMGMHWGVRRGVNQSVEKVRAISNSVSMFKTKHDRAIRIAVGTALTAKVLYSIGFWTIATLVAKERIKRRGVIPGQLGLDIVRHYVDLKFN
jgi:hypothetical protein